MNTLRIELINRDEYDGTLYEERAKNFIVEDYTTVKGLLNLIEDERDEKIYIVSVSEWNGTEWIDLGY